jgi:hypothetical protein
MQDLSVINRQNNEAVERDIPRQLANGNTVVAEYAGLHFVGYQAFSGPTAEADAQAKVKELESRHDSSHGRIFRPTTQAA